MMQSKRQRVMGACANSIKFTAMKDALYTHVKCIKSYFKLHFMTYHITHKIILSPGYFMWHDKKLRHHIK
jgi:hypothetical protein